MDGVTTSPHPILGVTTLTTEEAEVPITEAVQAQAATMIDHITEMAIVTATTRAVEVHLSYLYLGY